MVRSAVLVLPVATYIVGILDLVATCGPGDAALIGFFWAHSRDDAEVSGFATLRNGGNVN